ncbi:hypothetical protein [Sphaerisporangium sp. NPDC051011]|uniref:hypothetical protein n=1 Tax=Sphaerisporangium sp. NPDC051011 TaxID=3155792 RepID=UPI00341137C1
MYDIAKHNYFLGYVEATTTAQKGPRENSRQELYWAPDVAANMSLWKLREFESRTVEDFANNYWLGWTVATREGVVVPDCVTEISPLPANKRTEGTEPSANGPGLRWEACGAGQKTALLTDTQREQEANRSLFIAGALIGASVSLLLFAAQIFVDSASHREN